MRITPPTCGIAWAGGEILHSKEEEAGPEAWLCAWLVAHGPVSSSHSPLREALSLPHFTDEDAEW